MLIPAGNKIKYYGLLCMLVLLGSCQLADLNPNRFMGYYFDAPARVWEETIPLGNGRLGLMPDGGIDKETFVLNEISMWSGGRQDTDNPYAYWYLSRIRQLLFEGRNDEAQELMYRTFVCKGEGSGLGNGAELPYGSYQLLGNLELNYTYDASAGDVASGYRRELNLQEAIAAVSFKKGSVNYTREAFTSFAADLGVIYLTADVDRSVNFTLTMDRPERYQVETIGNDLLMEGQLTNGTDGEGVKYAARTRILLPKGGSLTVENNELVVKNASEVVILLAMATNYSGEDPLLKNQRLLAEVERKDYTSLKREHLAAYRELFGRVELDLGFSSREHQPIPERLKAFQIDGDDPGLAALYFHFGRYLLISSTRPGSLPPNLQGLWCNTINTPWNGDYHLNINLQMNHWPAEVCNLSELHEPLIRWTTQQVESGERTAKVFYNARGWVTHVLGNVWEFTAPGEHPSWGATNTSAAWLCQHLYMHYLYTLDRKYLEEVYPVMKGAALFFVDMLVEDPRNKHLVTAPTTSPENSFILPNGNEVSICAGSTMDNQLLRELFTHTIEAATILDTDSAFVEELKTKRSRLMPTTIGKDGRILEWLEPYQEAEPSHRHISHLYGLYPGNEISAIQTPRLAEAARKTLEGRGDQSTGWSMAWKINFLARLRKGDYAYKLIKDLLRPCNQTGQDISEGGGTYPNLFCAHPPFQIDGNLGGCAGIAEMLVQSQDGYIEYLPALPAAWTNGQFKGLKVRGGGEVAAKWKDGLLAEAALKATVSHTFHIKLPVNSENIALKVNQKPVSLPVTGGMLNIQLNAGEELFIQF